LVGENLLDVAIANDIDIEGACGGTLACSTCHLYIDEESFEK
jgi:ferredoxin